MATSGYFSTNPVGNFYFTFEWYRTGYDSSLNRNYIHYTLTAHNTPGNYRTVYLKNLWINGNQVFYEAGSSSNGRAYYDGNVVTSGDITVNNYNAEGDGWFNASFEAGVGSYPNSNCSGSGAWDTDRIPRYANFTEHYVQSTGLNSITIHWNADANCDYVQFSLNGGGWTDCSGLTYAINGLGPNTQYNIRTRIRRTDSQLWTESGYIYGTTKDIAKITLAHDFDLGSNGYLEISNPSGATIEYYIELLNPQSTLLLRSAVIGGNTIIFSDAELDILYKKMGTGNSVTVRYGVQTNGSYWHWVDKTCVLTGNQKTIKDNVSGAWKRGKVLIKVSGNWKRGVVWENVSGTWKRCI